MDLCVNFGGLERRPRRFILGFGSSKYQALPRSFHEGRPSPLTPIYHRDGPPRRQNRQHSLLWACKEKFTPWSYRNARVHARFFRFPCGPSHSSYSEQKQEKKTMPLFMLWAWWPGSIKGYPAPERRTFFCISDSQKWVKRFRYVEYIYIYIYIRM